MVLSKQLVPVRRKALLPRRSVREALLPRRSDRAHRQRHAQPLLLPLCQEYVIVERLVERRSELVQVMRYAADRLDELLRDTGRPRQTW